MKKNNPKNNHRRQERLPPEDSEEMKKDAQDRQARPSQQEEKISIPASELDELNKKARLGDEYYDKFLRLGAEFDNARKRMAREKEDLIKFAAQGLISEFLPIVDDFDRLIEGIKNNQINAGFLEGIKMIQKRIHALLEENGLARMKVVGEKFDPAKHEALIAVETDEYPEETIIEEIRSGYLLYDKVLRHAVVKVARKKTDSQEGTSAPEHQSTS